VLNKQVVRLINYFTSRRGSKTFKRTLERSGAYAKMIDRILEEEGVPKELFHLAQAESGFRPKARSYARATGMWQFMLFRGRQYGLRRDRYMDERNDPEKATRAAARHLKDLYIEFGDWYLAMAAYNGGPSRVRRGIKASGSRDYWELSRRRFLRRETRNYIPIILAMTYVAKNDWLYDSTEFDWAPELRYDTVETTSAIHFDVIADITGTNSEMIKQLNPALLRSATPPVNYALRLPEGTGELFEQEIALIPVGKRLAWSRYEVKAGDTLATIAKRFKIRETQVAELNSLAEGELPAGLRLTIPGAPKRVKSYYSGGAGGFLEGGTGRYRIARGDTLGGVARRFRVTVSQLRQWNSLPNTRIRAGRYLIVNPNSKSTAASRRPSGSKIGGAGKYQIRRGDNLSVIAARFGTSVSQLKAWNGLTSNRLQIGRYLVVQPAGSQTQNTRTARAPSAPSRSRRPKEPIPSGGRYQIRRGDNLSEIADRFGATVSELKRWNGLRSSRIRAGKYLTVGPATASTSRTSVTRATSATSSSAGSGGGRYKIRRGDTLELIAKRFGTTISDLKARNGLRSSRITAGAYLNVGSGGLAARNASASPRSTSPRVAANPARSAPQRNSTGYKIRQGDTLAVIARRLGVTVADLKAWNGLSSSRIRAGKYLAVHGSNGTSSGAGTNQYLIRNGDTLEAIASRFGVTVKQLQAWNGLRGTRIRAGKRLIVRPADRASAGTKVAAARAGS
jgi:membrane-bound lytic murein transglycosylase D